MYDKYVFLVQIIVSVHGPDKSVYVWFSIQYMHVLSTES